MRMGIGGHNTSLLLTGKEAEKPEHADKDTRWMGGIDDRYVIWDEVAQEKVPVIGPWMWRKEETGPTRWWKEGNAESGNAQDLYDDVQKQRFRDVRELLISAEKALKEGVALKFKVDQTSVREVLEALGPPLAHRTCTHPPTPARDIAGPRGNYTAGLPTISWPGRGIVPSRDIEGARRDIVRPATLSQPRGAGYRETTESTRYRGGVTISWLRRSYKPGLRNHGISRPPPSLSHKPTIGNGLSVQLAVR